MPKTYSGYTAKTSENLLFNAGAFFVNFFPGTDTFESAVTAGKLLGATRGGGQFSAMPEFRNLEVDGVKGKAKGLQVIDAWEVKMSANVLEVTREGMARALASTAVDTATSTTHDIVTARNQVNLTDYVDNITFVGTKSGSDQPVIVQIYNALNKNGLTLQTQDKGEAVIAMDFEGHYDDSDLDSPPFAIYYPKPPAPVV